MTYLSLLQSFAPYVAGWEHDLDHLDYISDLHLTKNSAIIAGKERVGNRIVVEKIDLDGNLVWRSYSDGFWKINSNWGEGADFHVKTIIELSDGSIVAGGRAYQQGVTLRKYGNYDTFVVKLSVDGRFKWVYWSNSDLTDGNIEQLFEGDSPDEIISVSHLRAHGSGDPIWVTGVHRFNQQGRLNSAFHGGKVTFHTENFIRKDSHLDIECSSISENIQDGSIVGALSICDCDKVYAKGFSFIQGVGDENNSDFIINGNTIRIIKSPDFSVQQIYSVKLQYTDPSNKRIENSFSFDVIENQAPTNLFLSALTFDEHIKSASTVSILGSSDPDFVDDHTYLLVDGNGGTDNAFFFIDGNQLKINASPDFESKSSYSIRLQTTDSGGLTLEKSFTLTVNDLNEVPTDLAISSFTFDENIAGGSVVASLSTSDPDSGDNHTYSLVSGAGDTDNSAFKIDGDQLKIINSPDFENKSSYSIRLQTTDSGGLTLEKEVTLNVADIPELLLLGTTSGTKVTIADTSSSEVVATSQSSPDLIEIKAPVTATLNALTTERYGIGLVARNVGTTTNEGTGQIIPLRGLGKYTFVATAIPEATTTINLEPNKDTAFFLHDAYSAFYTGLTLTPDSTGRQSHQRVLNVDTIFMGSGGGTSIVDLTSKDYVTGAVTVYGADKGRSIVWGTDANDTFISRGGDSVIFGGAGSNAATLGAGLDILQYRAGVGAVDRIEGFDPSRDVIEFWTSPVEKVAAPVFSQLNGSTVINWGGNTIEFMGLNLTSIEFVSRSATIA